MSALGKDHQAAPHQPAQFPFTRSEHQHRASTLIHTAWAGWDYDTEPGPAQSEYE